MLQDLNWRTLDQQRIDSQLVLLYKVTYDLVAIPASDYLIRNTCPSSRNHPIAYRQITTLKDFYKYTFLPRTIIQWNALPHHIPTLPTLAQFSTAVCQVAHSTPLVVRYQHQFYLLTLLTLSIALYKLISPTFFYAFIPPNTL